MGEQLKENYFTIVRIVMLLAFSAYGIFGFELKGNTGVSVWVLLLVSFFVTLMSLKEFFGKRVKLLMTLAAAGVLIALLWLGGNGFILQGCFLAYEFILLIKPGAVWYLLPYMVLFISAPIDHLTLFLVVTMMMVFYLQYEFVVSPYRKQMMEDTRARQGLKRDMENVEYAAKEELRKNLLSSENKILEERATLSQELHDKLGHSINGSVYQLEASKLILDKDPEKAKSMIQAVIDQLRSGMDEIRMILRREKPDKQKFARLQLFKLCEDCENRGVEAETEIEGDSSRITQEQWEVILDNAYEAVSNALKYSKCSRIGIRIHVMKQIVRCTIKDNGVGCSRVKEGMGISGMRTRVRKLGGTLDLETTGGFTINMLLPISDTDKERGMIDG